MSDTIELRPAALEDADLLLTWRNDPETRSASHTSAEVTKEDHLAWLTKTLKNKNRKLLIAQKEGAPVGTVRADFFEGVWELSWTVAPTARGRGVAKRMVALLAATISEPLSAEIKVGNIASARIAEYAGMTLVCEKKGILHYSRKSRVGGEENRA